MKEPGRGVRKQRAGQSMGCRGEGAGYGRRVVELERRAFVRAVRVGRGRRACGEDKRQRLVKDMVKSAALTLCKRYSKQTCGSARVCGRRRLVVGERRWAIRTGARQAARGRSVSAARRAGWSGWSAVGAVSMGDVGGRVCWGRSVRVLQQRYGGVAGMGAAE